MQVSGRVISLNPFFYSSHRWRPWGLAQVAPPSGHLRQARRSCRQVALTAHSWDSEYVLHMCQTNTFAHIWARKRDYVWKKKKWCQGKLALASVEFKLTVAQSASSSRGSGRFLCASMRINPPPKENNVVPRHRHWYVDSCVLTHGCGRMNHLVSPLRCFHRVSVSVFMFEKVIRGIFT